MFNMPKPGSYEWALLEWVKQEERAKQEHDRHENPLRSDLSHFGADRSAGRGPDSGERR